MIRSIKERYIINRDYKLSLETIEYNISQLSNADVVAICPKPTNNSWQGVLSATEGLFGNKVFKIPQYYSKNLH